MERASLTPQEVSDIVKRLYDLDVEEQRKLPSYYDVNFYVKCASTSRDGRDATSGEYVLKILNSEDSKETNLVDAVVEAMQCISACGIMTSQTIKTLSGSNYSTENIISQSGKQSYPFLVRLLQYIPGETLVNKPWTPNICYQIGQLAGKLDTALQDTSHPALKTTHLETSWSTADVPGLTKLLHYIENMDNRKLLQNVINEYEQNVATSYQKLKPGVIHGDLNTANILVEKVKVTTIDKDTTSHYTISGVIDFGDMTNSYVIFELAITMTYAMLDTNAIPPFEAAGHVLAGFLNEYNLPAFDLDLLKDCICGRLALSLVHGEYNYQKNPSDESYLDSAKNGWSLLRELTVMSRKDFNSRMQSILDQYGLPDIVLR